jgi:hypothetical protein
MCRDRGRDYDRVHVVGVDHVLDVGRSTYRGIAAAGEREPLRIEIADRDEFGRIELRQVANEVWAPVAEADDCGADRAAQAVARLWWRSANGVRNSSRRASPSDQPRT